MDIFLTTVLIIGGIACLILLKRPYPSYPLLTALFILLVGVIFGTTAVAMSVMGLVALATYMTFCNSTRKRFITGPLLKQFRKVMPAMSTTEREALNAGSVWWDAELFSGKPDWEHLYSLPQPQLNDEELAFIDGPVEQLCEMLDDWKITHEEHDLPQEAWAFLKQERFFGMIIPKAYGGLEFSALAHSQVVMKLASRSITAAVTAMVPNSLGPAKLLLHYGTEQQKEYYLPRLASGQEIPCFALTGPEAGSDAGALPDTGVIGYGDYKGEQILGITLNWEKRYITLGPVATVIGLAFKLYDPDHHLGDERSLGITVALIPTETPGIEIGQRHVPLDIPFQNGPNRGCNVFIPLDWVIGGRDGIGQGWRMLVESLAEGRGISLPALSTGAGKMACRYTGSYARIRQQFGLPIGYFEGVEEALARIAAYTYQMDAARLLTLGGLDAGERPSVLSAVVKYHLTERYRQVINDAMDVQGGSGICLGPNNLIGRAYQAIPIAITVEGANILTRSMIIFGQGAIRCHPHILSEFEAAHEPDLHKALEKFDEAIFAHAGFVVRNLLRTLFLGLGRGYFSPAPRDGAVKRTIQRLNWMSSAFALSADIAMMTLGGALKRKERLSARLGDILSELYLCSAVLKHFENHGRPATDLPLIEWLCKNSLYNIQESFRTLFVNLPFPPLGWLMRLLVFPSGMPFSVPDDRIGHEAARTLLSMSDVRYRLTEGIFITRNPEDRRGQLELALEQAEQVAMIEGTLKGARRSGLIQGRSRKALIESALTEGVISIEEKTALERMDQLRRKVIEVDAFDRYGGDHQKSNEEGQVRQGKAAVYG